MATARTNASVTKGPAKKAAAKKAGPKKVAAKKAGPKKASTKKASTKKAAAKKTAAKKTAAKKAAAKKTAAKKTAAKKTAAKKTAAKKAPAAKGSSGKTIASYIAGLGGWQAGVVKQLCALVEKAAPGSQGSIKWSQPVFEDHGPFCYVRAFASHVNFGFWRGADLPDPNGRLHGGGKKMTHIKLIGPQDVDEAAFAQLVIAAVALNRSEGDPTKPR